MPPEKEILFEVLRLYKQQPCLWDTRLETYTNKYERQKAYNLLLAKYNEVYPNTSAVDLKKKLDNMRTSFRREHKKVLVSRLNGSTEEYAPQLWYYDQMLFLNEICDYKIEVKETHDNEEETREEIIYSNEDSEDDKPRAIKRQKLSSVYLHDDTPYSNEEEYYKAEEYAQHTPQIVNATTEAESFGTTVGMQLKELDATQRIFAEKMISDVIYYARMNKLSASSAFHPTDKDVDI